jgi:hypothetical protein
VSLGPGTEEMTNAELTSYACLLASVSVCLSVFLSVCLSLARSLSRSVRGASSVGVEVLSVGEEVTSYGRRLPASRAVSISTSSRCSCAGPHSRGLASSSSASAFSSSCRRVSLGCLPPSSLLASERPLLIQRIEKQKMLLLTRSQLRT